MTPQCLGPAPTEPPQSGLGPCGNASTVGLVETAVDLKHPELAGHSIEVIELRPRKTRPSSNAHGTAVAMLFTGAAGAGAAGLLPDATMIVAVPYYRAKRSGDIALAFDVVRAIDALAQHNVDVINMSLTGPPNAVIERVLKRVHERGIPVVAAAGNAGARARPLYPAAYDTTIAVTAISASDKIYRRAIQGPHVDFAAPGVEVAFISSNGRMERRTGTSFAAPYVAAALAVLHRQNGKAGVDTLVSRLAPVARDLGGPGKDLVFGWGAIGLADICGR